MERKGVRGGVFKGKMGGRNKIKKQKKKKKKSLTRVGPTEFDLTGPGPVCLEPAGGFLKFEFEMLTGTG